MEINPIKTNQDYENALAAVSAYFDNEPEIGSEDGSRFEILLTLIDSYESNNFPIDVLFAN